MYLTSRSAGVVLAGALASSFAGTANAISYTFDLTGSTGIFSSLTVFDVTNSLSLNATAFMGGESRFIHRDGRGLGVVRGSGSPDSEQIDGANGYETLRLDLAGTTRYQLESVIYSRIAGSDDYHLLADGASAAWGSFPDNGNHVTIDYTASTIRGNVLDFTVLASNDDYNVRGLTLYTVPEPAGLALLGVGLLSFGWRRLAGGR